MVLNNPLKLEVREELTRRGFSLVRFASPLLKSGVGERFQEWLHQEFQGEMGYLARGLEKRMDPTRILPQVRSVIVLATDYDPGLPNTPNPKEGNISRYAWGDDYHEVIGDRLRDFQVWLKAKVGPYDSFASIDASPVLEKAWAEQAGLGWLGKHTNLIHQEKGSYFFLSALFTDLAFEPDSPVEDRCGTCTQCIDICPTKAIVAPYVLDARLCISYLTIELKGPIPRKLRPLIGNHIFGCDDCQEVCPWNRFSQATSEGRFFPREGIRNQPLVSFLSLSEAKFKQKFKGSAILRAKRRGFLRNVLVAIGNSGDRSLASAVHEKFSDPEPLVRGHAVWAYASLLGAGARAELRALRKTEGDFWVLEEIDDFI